MTTQEELEGVLVNAKADLAQAAADIAKAYVDSAKTEAPLPKAFSNLAKAKADLAKAEADLAKARTTCLTVHTTLGRLKLAEGKPSAYGPGPRSLAHEAKTGKAPRKANDNRRFSAQAFSSRDTLAGPPILRPTISLLALTLAYLLYFHIDVQLQILSQPSTFSWSLRQSPTPKHPWLSESEKSS